ncbi:putative polyketide synthase [Emericellopsis cladophorae]|uniref:Polyketide synthase n=1 Tax=Emericellopsis cladophorae TaxID=2686198 RepID=A0A9P9XV21_9HYPO|nr:putative polyketide synthase [Emericellopsis cladophorae]KAI6778347.1 putative polyketide synthase [Emericellopsis cladophorae]
MALPGLDKQEPIAIVGVGFRFAGGVSSSGSLWEAISKVKTCHGRVPKDRWNSDVWHHPDPDRKGGIGPQHGYFLDQDISHFDAPFFSVTAKEAASMDPMKRMLLEVCYESIENAGIPVEDLMNSRTGCYVGCMTNDYEMISLHDIYDVGHPAATGLSEAMTANRVSWFFGLKGPSLTLDTACSSSLYALHLACQSLRLKETNMSLVAGVNLMINPNTSHQLTAMHMLSPDGISHTFDERANGYGRGDGIGSMVIKRLSDAIRDGDTIRAVIRGSGVNADGKTPSVTQPSSWSQMELIRQTYEDAGLGLSETGYFECHGTGTPVGDPLELAAIAQTLGAARRAAGQPPLPIGSIKPTVGHTEGCAGLAGIFKSILLLEKGMLVPTHGVERVNPQLKLDDWHLSLPQDVVAWPGQGLRRISVNSFGFGGANAHVILDDAYHYLRERCLAGKHNVDVHIFGSDSGISSAQPSEPDLGASKKLFVFSSKDQAGTARVTERFAAWLQGGDLDEKHHGRTFDDIAYTLAQRRSHMGHRTFALAASMPELSMRLSRGLPAATRAQRHGGNIVMIFTGQGAQWSGMAQELFEYPTFHQSIQASQSYLEALGCKWNVREELSQTPNINLPEYSQPLCTIIQIALVDLVRAWKIVPAATLGHSSGEIAAAYAASLITHQDAIKLAYVRGISSAGVRKQGAMMAVGLSQSDAQAYVDTWAPGSVVVACVNSPSSVTLSGDADAIHDLETKISGDGKFARKLKVTIAYHSPHMREVSSDYLAMIGSIAPKQPDEETDSGRRPVMYSSLTGSVISSAEKLDAQYWVDNMQSPVQFSQALSALLMDKKLAPGATRSVPWAGFLEVGPHAALQGPVRQIITATNNTVAASAPYVSLLLRGKDAMETSLEAAGRLWAVGAKVDLAVVNNQHQPSDAPQVVCDLPAYPWNHARSFWHESYSSRAYRFPREARHELLGVAEYSCSAHEPRWGNYLRITENPWIEDHVITGTTLYPGAGMLAMALEAALRTADSSRTVDGLRMTDVLFERGLVISLDDASPVETRISLHLHSTQPDCWLFNIYSMSKASSWAKHCSGTIAVVYEKGSSEVEEGRKDASWHRHVALHQTLLADPNSSSLDITEFYDELEAVGMQYGPAFRNVVSLAAIPSQQASYGTVSVPDTRSIMPSHHESPHVIHPATLDSIFHLVIASLDAGRPQHSAVPYAIQDLYIARDQPQRPGALYSGYGRLVSRHGHQMTTELVVSDQDWQRPRIVIRNFALRQVTSPMSRETAKAASASGEAGAKCAEIAWIPDLSFVTSNGGLASLASSSGKATRLLDAVFDAALLKRSDSVALIALFNEAQCHTDILLYLKNRAYPPRRIVALATSETQLHTMRALLGEGAENMTIIYKWVPESELLQTLTPDALDVIIGLCVPDAASNAAVFAKLAPVALVTQDGQLDESLDVPGSCVATLAEERTYILTSARDRHLATLPELPESVVLLLPASMSDAVKMLVAAVSEKLAGLGMCVEQCRLDSDGVASVAGKSVLSLLEIERPLVYAWDEDQFCAFKALISAAGHVLWVTHGGVLESWANGVEFATSQGLFRVLRNEYPATQLPSLDLSALADMSDARYTDLIVEVWQASLAEDAETEYAERHGVVFIARAKSNAVLDNELALANDTAQPIWSTLGATGRALWAKDLGDMDKSHVWIPEQEADADLASGQVEVKVEYAGLGQSRTMASLHHAVGVVSRLSDSVKSFEIGQRVIVFCHIPPRTHVRQAEALVASLPEGYRPEEAVALVEPLITAQYALVDKARLGPGQTLLLDRAASAVGQALVQVATHMGAEVFALVHDRAERDILADRYGIAKDRIFDSALDSFVPLVREATGGRGVDVVVSQQRGSHIAGAMSVLNDFGQFLMMDGQGFSGGVPASKSNVALTCVDIAALIQGRPDLVPGLFERAFADLLLLVPVPLTVLPVTKLPAAMRSISSEQVVLSLDDTMPVLMSGPPPEELKLDDEALYVLAGGLGALGLDIAEWMVECGAKHLVFLSRSGAAKNPQALQRFAERSVRVQVLQCDINDAANVAAVFDTLKRSGKRLAGVVQLAMVLEDAIFENMSFEQWRRAIQPKTKGSRNLLANLWPGDKPFYILLSSITGVIGNTAQANYASGNTFEDALAHHARDHLDIDATSIDVGLVSDSSHFTGSGGFGELSSYLSRYQHGWRGLQTSLHELGAVMRAIMRGSATDGQRAPAQVILGLGDRIEHNESTGGYSGDKKFALRVVNVDNQAGNGEAKEDVRFRLASATSVAEAAAAVEGSIKELVAVAMGISVEDVDAQKPLYDYGVDSLQAVEIRNRALKNMQSEVSVFDILSAMPLADLAAQIAAKSQLVKVGTGGEE